MAEYNMTKPQNAANYMTFQRGVRERLLADPGWVNWNRLGKTERQDWLTTYRLGRHGNRFIPTGTDPFASLPKSQPKVGMSCEKCKELGKTCTGIAPNICPQCAVAGLKPEECVYLDDSLKLSLPAWYRRGVGGGGGGARGLEGAACMSWVKVETVSIKFVILISNAACEFVIIWCTLFSSNIATDDIAAWRLCAGGGESGLCSEERIC